MVDESKEIALAAEKEMANIEAMMAKEMAGIQDQIGAPSSNKIKTGDKVFTFPDGNVSPDAIEVVVLDFISRNKLYEGKYDVNNPAPPVCFSQGKVLSSMAPSEKSEEAQSDGCKGCPMNQFGSDGNGKACKNTRVLAVMPPDAKAGDDIMTLEVSPSSLKSFDAFVANVARLYNKPTIAVTVEVSFDQNVTYSKLVFDNIRPNTNLPVHFSRRAEGLEIISVEPNYDTSGDAAPRNTARSAQRKAVRRR